MIDKEIKELMSMKDQLEEVSLELARLEGRYGDLLKRLKEKSGHSDIKKAETVKKKLQKKLEEDEQTLSAGVTKLEENYEW